MKRPSFQFYPGDWLRDPALRACSVAARGLWMDMICIMHEGQPYGHLTLNYKDILPPVLARILGISLVEIEGLLLELEEVGVFSRTESGCIYSRRMIEDERIRQARASGGYKSLNNPNVPKSKKKEGHPSRISFRPSLGGSPSSSSSSSIKDNTVDKSTVVSPAPADQVFDHWKTSLNHPRSILDAKRRRLINERLKEGFSVEDLKSAIDGCKQSPFHQGENDRRQVYDDISLICRDAAKVEQFMACRIGLNGSAAKPKPEYTGLTWATMTEEQRARFRN